MAQNRFYDERKQMKEKKERKKKKEIPQDKERHSDDFLFGFIKKCRKRHLPGFFLYPSSYCFAVEALTSRSQFTSTLATTAGDNVVGSSSCRGLTNPCVGEAVGFTVTMRKRRGTKIMVEKAMVVTGSRRIVQADSPGG